jgi:hypothetical protein
MSIFTSIVQSYELSPTHAQTEKLEAMSQELSRISGKYVTRGVLNAGGDEGVTRFDFDEDVPERVAVEMQERGLGARAFRNSVWLWARGEG